ncbi:MAG: hypothetical protein Q7K98_06720 [Candidatus Omnitrophota bacterium]|nr:hypothetical protein [Candidatus Omnitrophota bacterium]
MKKLVLIVMAVCLVAGFAFAAETQAQAPAASTITGDIIDNMCAGSQKPEALAAFVKTHTKQCALMPQCAASGYSILSDSQLSKFDKGSNAKIEEFLKQADSKLQVVVVAKKVGDELSLVSIENQQ